MKKYCCWLLVFSFVGLNAQQWQSYYSYNNIEGVVPSDNNLIYAYSENALFSYDPLSGELQTLTTVEGLSGDEISALFVMDNILFIGHQNGLLGIYELATGAYFLDSGIERNLTIAQDKKAIQDFHFFDGHLYLSTGYGISVYDPANKVFRDTYYLGPNNSHIGVHQSTVYESTLYAATEIGLLSIAIDNPSIIQSDSWTQTESGNWVGIGMVENSLVGVKSSGSSTQVQTIGAGSFSKNINGSLVSLLFNDNLLTLTFKDKVIAVNEGLNDQLLSRAADLGGVVFTTSTSHSGVVYVGTASDGLLQISGTEIEVISPPGPLLNDTFHLALQEDQIWIVHGNFSGSYNPHPLNSYGISHLTENNWNNIPYQDVFDAKSLGRVVLDPNNPNTVYVCSFHSGLLEITEGVPKTLWDHTNSGLEALDNIKFNAPPTYKSLRLRDATFDSKGNMWSVTALVEKGLKKRTPSGNWESVDLLPRIGTVFNGLGYSNIVISKSDEIFVGSIVSGVIGYRETNGNALLKGMNTENNLPVNDVRALALDADNHLWIGTTEGLRVLYNASRLFGDQEVQAREVIVQEGGNLAELLNNQYITAIEVDGNNQKWVATADSGVFLFSEDGTETLHHFTKENSPLPTNSIRTIAIDDSKGIVYFGTPNGLVSFQGNAFGPQDNFDQIEVYPNPVRPGFAGRLTIRGLQSDSNVKITDISGRLVFETQSEGGSVQWDLKNFRGNRVRTGVYLIFVSDRNGTESAVEKVMIVN